MNIIARYVPGVNLFLHMTVFMTLDFIDIN